MSILSLTARLSPWRRLSRAATWPGACDWPRSAPTASTNHGRGGATDDAREPGAVDPDELKSSVAKAGPSK
ncbi:unnamed protein product, partial [Lampetra fluviatilis]